MHTSCGLWAYFCVIFRQASLYSRQSYVQVSAKDHACVRSIHNAEHACMHAGIRYMGVVDMSVVTICCRFRSLLNVYCSHCCCPCCCCLVSCRADLTLENRQLSQDLLTATTPTEGLFSSLFSRRTASMSSTQQQPQLSHNAASLPDRSTASSRGNSASGDATELRNATDLARSSSTSPSTATASDGALDE